MQRIDRFVEELKRDGAEMGATVILSALSRQLDEGRYSCVVYNNGQTRTFKQRGVLDLYDLVCRERDFLKGALMSDKIVGKGAAALMILGGVKGVRTEVVSTPALKMLTDNGIKVVFDTEVPYVENRRKTGQCPLDNRLQGVSTADESWPIIEQFVADLRAGVDVMQ